MLWQILYFSPHIFSFSSWIKWLLISLTPIKHNNSWKEQVLPLKSSEIYTLGNENVQSSQLKASHFVFVSFLPIRLIKHGHKSIFLCSEWLLLPSDAFVLGLNYNVVNGAIMWELGLSSAPFTKCYCTLQLWMCHETDRLQWMSQGADVKTQAPSFTFLVLNRYSDIFSVIFCFSVLLIVSW